MFCAKCGSELKVNEAYCPRCGAKVGVENPTKLNIANESIQSNAIKVKENFVAGIEDLGKNKILLFANIALLLLSIVFAVTDTFKVDGILGINESTSMFDDMEGVRNFYIIGYILAIVCLLIPLLLRKAWKPVFFLPAKIITILSTAWFMFFLFVGLNEVSSSQYSSMVEFAPTVAGWLFIITTLGALFLSFKLALDFKKLAAMAKKA